LKQNSFRAGFLRRHVEVIEMPYEPYLRASDDGTYELLVPWAGGVHVLPYCFHTEEDAASWLSTPKGRDQLRQIRARYRRKSRESDRLPYQERAVRA
jgi:hypothetical protein